MQFHHVQRNIRGFGAVGTRVRCFTIDFTVRVNISRDISPKYCKYQKSNVLTGCRRVHSIYLYYVMVEVSYRSREHSWTVRAPCSPVAYSHTFLLYIEWSCTCLYFWQGLLCMEMISDHLELFLSTLIVNKQVILMINSMLVRGFGSWLVWGFDAVLHLEQ